MPRDCIYIIDTFSLMFQVFHAIPPMTGTQGQPTNAVFGFTRDILAILERQPTHLVCAFDSPGDGVRNSIYPQYKANRSEMPEDLRPQIPMLKELLSGFRIPVVELAEWEADDVIATLTARAVARDLDVVIVSSDKDVRQLIGPRVRMFNCRKGTFLDEAGVMEDWGVRPDQVIDYQSLVGDAVDNVPGIPKIGPKTAQALIASFGSLDNILANADKAPGRKLAQSLVEFADQARMSRELVRLRTDLPLPMDLDEARISTPDHAALLELFTRLGFRRYATQMREAMSAVSGTLQVREASSGARRSAILVRTFDDFQTATDSLPATAPVLIEYAASGTGVRDRVLRAAAIRCGETSIVIDGSQLAPESKHTVLCWLANRAAGIVTSNGKTLCHMLLQAGVQLPPKIVDVSVIDYLLDAGARSHDLVEIADRHVPDAADDHRAAAPSTSPKQKTMFDDDPDSASSTASSDCQRRLALLEAVVEPLQRGLVADTLLALYNEIEEPLIRVLARMEFAGIRVDVNELKRQSSAAAEVIDRLTSEVFAIAGKSFNIDSPKQLSAVLFTDLQLPILKKTQTGASTDQEVLEELAALHPLPARIIERRHLIKLKGTYLDALPAAVHASTHRVHATFHQTVASTGRLSASDPNLQNIPIRTVEGRQVRRAFQPGTPGWQLVCADYSQIELRVLAHFSGDQALMAAFRDGVDIHAAVAAQVFNVPVSDVTSDQRRVAKAVNFGVIYGQSPWGLATALGIEKSVAAKFIDDYFTKYSGVATFCEHVLRETDRTGFARTILNRRRAITGIRNVTGTTRGMAERTAINTVIQGSAADLIKKAMLDIDAALATSPLRATMLLQIHDELVFECHPDDVDQFCDMVRDVMQNAMRLDVPLEVDVTIGPNWLDQTDVSP